MRPRSGRTSTGRGTGLPPQYSPREEDVRERYAAPRESYERAYGDVRAQGSQQIVLLAQRHLAVPRDDAQGGAAGVVMSEVSG